jgi:DNA invertase Pin-like site-specific DNA recombinase
MKEEVMATGQQVGYTRVSTALQNTARQLDGVSLDRVFEDRASGKDANRPELVACMKHLREGDTLHIHSMDRLARNLDDLRHIVNELNERGVVIAFHKEQMTFRPVKDQTDKQAADMARLMLSIMGAVAEFERAMILERQREGIAIAKAEGKYKGRKPKLLPEQVNQIRARAQAGENKTKLAKEYGISRDTLYTHLQAA